MTDQVFDRSQGPTQVRRAVETAVEEHDVDPWAEIESREGVLAVGRMRLMGVYDDRQENRFMLRIRIPGGRISPDQLECVAGVIRDFGNGWEEHVEPDRFGEITTRQDIQVHWVRFDELPEIWRRFDAVGLTSAQACGDSMRNPTACAVDGEDPRGYLTVAPLLDEFRTFALEEESLTAFLPRKWKVVTTGCPTDCAAVKLHCLAFTPARGADGALGFNVHAGGGLSDSPRIADPLDLFVRPDQVTDTVRATLQVYREFGEFDLKAVNRFRVLVHEMGPDRVTEELQLRIGSATDRRRRVAVDRRGRGPPGRARGRQRLALRGALHPDGPAHRRRVVRGRPPGPHVRRRRHPDEPAAEPDADGHHRPSTGCSPSRSSSGTRPSPTRSSARSSRARRPRSASSRSTT